jgi:hypothetical protein
MAPIPTSVWFGPVVCSGQWVPWAKFENGRVEGLGNAAKDVDHTNCKSPWFPIVLVQFKPFTDVEVVGSKAREDNMENH